MGKGEEIAVTEELNTKSLKILQSLRPEWLHKSVRDDEALKAGDTRYTWDKAISKMIPLYQQECAAGHDVKYTYRVTTGSSSPGATRRAA